MTYKDLIKKVSIKEGIEEDIVEDIIKHQYKLIRELFKESNISINLKYIGKFKNEDN